MAGVVSVYVLLMLAFWFLARQTGAALSLGHLFPRAFASFALLFAPLWFFGFGAGESLRRLAKPIRMLIAGTLAVPYFVFALGTAVFYWRAAVVVIALPILLAGFLGSSNLGGKMTWRDVAAVAVIVATYFLHWLQIAWPGPQFSLLAKLFLADIALYCFLAVRELQDAGFSLWPSASAAGIGLREWLFYLLFALVLGLSTGFIHFHRLLPAAGTAAVSIIVTFFLIALPEELFFRCILQNLLESRLGRNAALVIAAILFGLSHFNHGEWFNWRYVLLGSVAGIFYGRAWRAKRQVFAAMVAHTAVDVVWSLWFR